MNFKKCERCGCFFTSNDTSCPNCIPKDNFEMSKLKNYLADNSSVDSIQEICLGTGISVKNINRYFGNKDFTDTIDTIKKEKNTNINL